MDIIAHVHLSVFILGLGHISVHRRLLYSKSLVSLTWAVLAECLSTEYKSFIGVGRSEDDPEDSLEELS